MPGKDFYVYDNFTKNIDFNLLIDQNFEFMFRVLIVNDQMYFLKIFARNDSNYTCAGIIATQ